MKRVILAMAFVLLSASFADAKPFLVSDPQEGVQGYEVTGIPAVPPLIAAQVDGALKYDLSGLPIGSYNSVTVKACNVWGCGEAEVMPPFTKTLPKKPANLRLSAE